MEYLNREKVARSWRVALLISAIALVVGGIVNFSSQGAAQNLPTQIESLRGRVWNGGECCGWKFSWQHKSGPFFRGKWWHPNGQQLADDNITVNILDDNVEVIRAGGSSAGGCTYRGKIHVGDAGGEYWCNGRYAGKWGAVILQ